jgi:hypothetical protein
VNIGKAPGVCVTKRRCVAHLRRIVWVYSEECLQRMFEGKRLFALLGFTSEPKQPFTKCTALITLLLAVRIRDGRRRV